MHWPTSRPSSALLPQSALTVLNGICFDVNVRVALNTSRAAFPYLREAGGGRVINLGAAVGLNGMPGAVHYVVSKGAVLAWSRTISREWARYGIRVNAVGSVIWTPMYNSHRAKMIGEELAAHDQFMSRIVPLGGKLGNADRGRSL